MMNYSQKQRTSIDSDLRQSARLAKAARTGAQQWCVAIPGFVVHRGSRSQQQIHLRIGATEDVSLNSS